jgi:hypothetical protein
LVVPEVRQGFCSCAASFPKGVGLCLWVFFSRIDLGSPCVMDASAPRCSPPPLRVWGSLWFPEGDACGRPWMSAWPGVCMGALWLCSASFPRGAGSGLCAFSALIALPRSSLPSFPRRPCQRLSFPSTSDAALQVLLPAPPPGLCRIPAECGPTRPGLLRPCCPLLPGLAARSPVCVLRPNMANPGVKVSVLRLRFPPRLLREAPSACEPASLYCRPCCRVVVCLSACCPHCKRPGGILRLGFLS